MAYLTDRKRVRGLGVARSGTGHHWSMTVTSVSLIILVPLFVFTFGPTLGSGYQEVSSYYARPFPAVVAGLTIIVGFHHFKNGVMILIEDYVHGFAREALIVATSILSYGLAAVGIFALARIAL